MTRTVIRQESNDPDMYSPNRGICLLDDGTAVALVVSEEGTADWRLMHSVDRINWTIAFQGTTLHPRFTSMTIDAGNGIHLVYQKIGDTAKSIYYRPMTKGAGYTWTAGTERLVATPAAGNVFAKRDVEIFPTGAVVVAVNHTDNSVSPKTSQFRLYTMPGGGSTFTLKYSSPAITDTPSVIRTCTVARSLAAPAGNVYNAMLGYCIGANDPTTFRSFGFDVTTGNISNNNVVYQVTPESKYPYTVGHIFGTNNDEWVFCGAQGHASSGTGQQAIAIKMNMTSMLGIATLPKYDYTGSDPDNTLSTACYMGTGKVILLSPWRTGVVSQNGIQATVCTIVGNTLTWGTPFTYENDLGFEFMRSGANRNFSSLYCDIISCRTYDQRHAVIKLDTPDAPTAVGPSGTGVTATPTLTATLSASQGRLRGVWNVAANSGFTGAVKSFTDPESDMQFAGTTFENVDTANALTKGTWYIRARTFTEFGTVSAWSTISTLIIAHPPTTTGWYPQGSASVFSSAGGGFKFTWQFSDPYSSDSQTAYQIQVLNASGSVIYDTGKVASALHEHAITTQLDTYVAQDLSWQIKVWDTEDTPSVAFSAAQLFRVYASPTIVVTAPTGTIDNPNPAVTWTFSTGGDGRTQTQWKVSILNLDTMEYVLQTPYFYSAALTYAPTNINLFNATNYRYTVTVIDSVGLEQSATQDVLTSWVPPMYPPFTVDTLSSATDGYAVIAWDNSVKATGFQKYRVYRRLMGSTVEELIYETSDDITNYVFNDWIVPSNSYQEWSVVQVVDRFGSQVESIREWTADYVRNDDYWLLHPTDSSRHVKLDNVTAENMSDDQEEEITNVINRGRHKDVGTYLGYSGTLSVQFWGNATKTAREQKLELELLRRENTILYLRNPFGDIYQVASGIVTIERVAGVGTREFHTASIPYVSVGTPVNVGVIGDLANRRRFDVIYGGGDDNTESIQGG